MGALVARVAASDDARRSSSSGGAELRDETYPVGLFSTQLRSEEHDLQCAGATDGASEPLRSPPRGDHTKLDLGKTDLCARRRDPKVTAERDLETTADTRATDGAHDGLRHGLDASDQSMPLVDEVFDPASAGRRSKLPDVGADREILAASTPEHDRSNCRVLGDLFEYAIEPVDQSHPKWVIGRGVELYRGDLAVAAHEDRVFGVHWLAEG